MSGTSGVIGTDDYSAIIGRFSTPVGVTDGFAAFFRNNWDDKHGYANAKVKCVEVSDRRGRLTFTTGLTSFSTDFVFKTGYDGLVLMRTDPEHAVVGDALRSAPFPDGGKICALLKEKLAGSLDGVRPRYKAARLLQFDFDKAKPTAWELEETDITAATLRRGSAECEPTGLGSARLKIFYVRGGSRLVEVFLGGEKLDTMPAIDSSPNRHESGWLYVQPDPIEIPG